MASTIIGGQKPSISDTKPAADVFKPDEGPYLERHVRPEVSSMSHVLPAVSTEGNRTSDFSRGRHTRTF
ncbi:uncharacterized protein LOC143228960 isoform X4 [Tachypleus tridentatus]|uniref:uncharacterized protein LOC143228960 isoform X4 n=1 Tax=Tachypleus tridentatus TaxID=6853 RepID=UPI003FD3A34E